MNYESDAMSPDEMVDATYEAGLTAQPRQSRGVGSSIAATAARDREAHRRSADDDERIDEIMEASGHRRESSRYGRSRRSSSDSPSPRCARRPSSTGRFSRHPPRCGRRWCCGSRESR